MEWDKQEDIKELVDIILKNDKESLLLMASLMYPAKMEALTNGANIDQIMKRNKDVTHYAVQNLTQSLKKTFWKNLNFG